MSRRVVAVVDTKDDIFSQHDARGHPECQARLNRAIAGIPEGVERIDVQRGREEWVTRLHSESYLDRVKQKSLALERSGKEGSMDEGVYLSPMAFEASMYAVGGSIQAVHQAVEKDTHAFALVRPPGHHAEADRARGFCIFGNASIAAQYALEDLGLDKVAVIDWDYHHGNGTQDFFYDRNDVLYCSTHGGGYPGSGSEKEAGIGDGKGFTLNCPIDNWNERQGVTELIDAYKNRIAPAVRSYNPDLIIVSAGQDILHDDPVGGLGVQPEQFKDIVSAVMSMTENPLALIMEGGYGKSLTPAFNTIFKTLQES